MGGGNMAKLQFNYIVVTKIMIDVRIKQHLAKEDGKHHLVASSWHGRNVLSIFANDQGTLK
jgi:hypothetical protein